MTPKKKRQLTPQLRFPEFRDTGGWEVKELSDLIKVITPPKKIPTTQYSDSGLFPIIDQSQAYIAGWTNDQDAVISDELPLIIFGDHTCILKITDTPFAQGADGIKIFRPSSSVLTGYLYQYLLFNPVKMERYKRHFSTLKSKIIAYPVEKSNEQQKIADCLTTLDDLIAAHTQKLDALRAHKKGLLQQLFPAAGETVPQLRFPEFRDAGAWEKVKLGDICEIQRGKFSHRPRNDPKFFGGKYPFIQTGDVVRANGGIVQASQSLNERGLAVSKLFKPTIVLITIAANIGDTGILDYEACFTDSVVGLIPNAQISPYFLELAMRGQKDRLNAIAPQAAQKNINNKILSIVNILIPSFPEQQRIAACFASLDDQIAAQSQKIATLNAHKKGLLQQLFPSPEEI